jgi:hypothetical protein
MMKDASSVSHAPLVRGCAGPTPGFALRPLSTTLVSEHAVEIRKLDPRTGTWGAGESRNFQDIDLDVWARIWLADMDRIRGAPGPARSIAPEALDRLREAGRQLACAVSGGLSPILAARETAGDSIGSPAWKTARGVLHRRLLAGLAAGYDTAGVFQCEALVCFPMDASRTARHRALAPGSVDSRRIHASLLSDPAIASMPVPLRLYPAAPTLISQTAEPPRDRPETVADALLWTYSFTCAHPGAAQDQMLLTIEFNRPRLVREDSRVGDDAPPQTRDGGDSLFKALAQYVCVRDALWALLAGLRDADPDAAAGETLLAPALDAYAGLAERVAGLWSDWWGVGGCDDTPAIPQPGQTAPPRLAGQSRHWTEPASPGGAVEAGAPASGANHGLHRYLATLDAAPVKGVDVHVFLTLKRIEGDGRAEWPEIAAILEDGTELPLAPDAPESDTRAYRFPVGGDARRVPATSVPGFRYRFANLPVPACENAHAAASVVRNARLLGAEGPETCPAFVYRTPQVGFADPVAPSISVDTRLDIGTWTSAVETNPLTALFGKLFGDDTAGRDMAMEVRYAYPLADSPTPMEVAVPVALQPRSAYPPSSTVRSLIDALERWMRREQPATAGGVWIFSLTLYSGIDTSRELPLLELRRLVSPLG